MIKGINLKSGKSYRFKNVRGLLASMTIKIVGNMAYYGDGSRGPIQDLENYEFYEVS